MSLNLPQLYSTNQSSGEGSNMSMSVLIVLFLTSLSSTIEVILECSIGFILAKFKPVKILNSDRIRFLSKLWFNLFIPCMFFINLTTSFSLQVFQKIYMVFLYSVILEVLGIVLGKLLFLKWFWKDRLDDISRTVLTLTLVCHTSVSLPLVYIVALCNVSTLSSNPVYKMTFDEAHKSALTTLSVFIIPTEFVFCTIGFNAFRYGAARLKRELLVNQSIMEENREDSNEISLSNELEHEIFEEIPEIKEHIEESETISQLNLAIEMQPENHQIQRNQTIIERLKLFFKTIGKISKNYCRTYYLLP
ncbi:predicted protein [Naegleria gruberi]|uniref:Predicted protein n=1 Tax=Naegleria gruberi TaxID=5762 RepID=D2VPW9_NAEGR|nr:uncharacterized protein NAEGRDRAFT_71014 [Naegleria gruberi]EFC41278.1 predicted protein [Naegleria gruberi]|eukprot:XP_002674022.1 predicted protein [Naegleria gruberi strain NEG-M]